MENRARVQVDKIEELVRRAEALEDVQARALTSDLLRAVLEFHEAGLDRIMGLICSSDGPGSDVLVEAIAEDELTGALLLLHGLHPHDTETRVRRAIDALDRQFGRRGGSVALVALDGDHVQVRFSSSRPWTGSPLQELIEQTLFGAAPELQSVGVEGADSMPMSGFVPLASLTAGQPL